MSDFDDRVFNTVVALDGMEVTMRELFEVFADDLSSEYAKQAPRLAWLGVLEARAEANFVAAKNAREREYAKAQRYYRTPGKTPNDIKVTDAAVDALCKTDIGYVEALDKEADALEYHKIVKALSYAMRQRGDMLVSLGATQRSEFDSTAMHVNRLRRTLREVGDDDV